MYNAQKMGWIKKYTFRWLLVSIFIVLCNYGMSQNFSGGLMGGFTTSQVNGDENGGFHRIGPMGGIFAEYHQTKDSPFFHVFELRFAEKGAANAGHDFKTSLGYVDAGYLWAVRPAYFIGDNFPARLRFKVGTEVSAKIYENTSFNGVKNKSEALGRLDWQICGAFDFMFPRVSFEAGTTYSIIPIENRYRNLVLYACVRVYVIQNLATF